MPLLDLTMTVECFDFWVMNSGKSQSFRVFLRHIFLEQLDNLMTNNL